MIQVVDFFKNINALKNSKRFESEFFRGVVAVADSMVRATGCGAYIFDYLQQTVVYVSQNIAKWCDATSNEITKHGYDFYLKYINDEDLEMLFDINNAVFEFWNSIPNNECANFVVSYDFKFATLMVNQRYTPIVVENNNITMAICVVSLSSSKTSGNIVMDSPRSEYKYEYSLPLKKWIKKRKIFLTDKEKEIICLSVQGFTSAEIAEKTSSSTETIRTQKKHLYKKLHVGNITEAVRYVLNNSLW